jgi:hypothetical protein
MEAAEFVIYSAKCRGKGNNAKGFTQANYINTGDTAALAGALQYDNCPAWYRDGYRHSDNFTAVNCILADTDNTHSDDPGDWITHKDIAAKLPGVRFYTYPSRNHMKEKEGQTPRPKEHHIFPVDLTTNINEYTDYMKWLIDTFPELHFDPQVSSPAQLNFGVENPQVTYIPGEINLTEFKRGYSKPLSETGGNAKPGAVSAETNIQGTTPPVMTGHTIAEGHRNSTLSHMAGKLLKKYGDTKQAHAAFMEQAAGCTPPLEQRELDTIYKSAQRFFNALRRPGGNGYKTKKLESEQRVGFRCAKSQIQVFFRNLHGRGGNNAKKPSIINAFWHCSITKSKDTKP